jgi:tetratricopeptide (TPR) repeat protein
VPTSNAVARRDIAARTRYHLAPALGVLLSLALAMPAASQLPRDQWADSARRQIEAAVERADAERLAAARRVVERALVEHPDDGLLLHYQGYALWREGSLVAAAGDEKRARTLLEQASRTLERSAERLPLAETHAVRASVLGQMIGLGANPFTTVKLGRQAGAELSKAEKLGPQNPRVALIRGVAALNAPRLMGGSVEKAERHLTQALELYASDRPAAPLPDWGHAEALAYLGQLHARTGRAAEARAAYQQALVLQPANRWVREALLPAIASAAPER